MYASLSILAATLSAVHLASAQGLRGCGFKIAPCPPDTICVPDSDDCADLNRCPGSCEFRNKYPSCGGFRVEPLPCEEGATCKDDPRLPDSCGMACDMAGICVPDDAPSCVGGAACPPGLYCYTPMTKYWEVEGVKELHDLAICL